MEAAQIGLQIMEGARRILDAFEADGRRIVVTIPADGDGLSERQIEVCRHAAQGHADKWIGYELGIARSTVATHLSAALERLNLSARTDIARVWPLIDGTTPTLVMQIELDGQHFAALVAADPTDLSIDGLTAAEQEVMAQAIRGASNADIAERRGTSTRTVANQLASIYRKLGLCSRTELAAFVA